MAKAEGLAQCTGLIVTLVYSPAPRQTREWTLALESGATVAQALACCSLVDEFPELKTHRLLVGIWGRRTGLDHALAECDRIEVYRALRVDPKVARRERFDRQGAKSAGLFNQKRPGAKAGY